MKKKTTIYRNIAICLLLALLMSLIVNFSYLVSLRLNNSNQPNRGPSFENRDFRPGNRMPGGPDMRRIDSLKADSLKTDSLVNAEIAFAPQAENQNDDNQNSQLARQFNHPSDTLKMAMTEGGGIVASDSINPQEVFNREEDLRKRFEKEAEFWGNFYTKRYNMLVVCDFMYYTIISFILLILATLINIGGKKKHYVYAKRLVLCLVAAIVFYFLAPQMTRHGRIIITMQSWNIYNPMLILKVSLIFVIAALYGKIYELLYEKQKIVLENELLKNENLVSQYNVLVNQVNPHFFFNSLNSLAMLVRENRNDVALTYIDQLSDTFRYIIQDGKNGITTLENELKFLDAYKYLFEIRYAGKLFIDVDVDTELSQWNMPSLSLQPLIENAVKHNIITTNRPLHIHITTENESLVVANQMAPKMDNSDVGTGIGLSNLSSRYVLLTKHDISIINDGKTFTVKLPLTKPTK